MDFWSNLKAYREQTGLNAKDFAEKIGINYTTYMGYENQGKEPKLENLAKIAAALHVSIDNLVDYQPNKLEYWNTFLKKSGFTIEKQGSELEIKEHGNTLAYVDEKEFLENVEHSDAVIWSMLQGQHDELLNSRLRAYITLLHANKKNLARLIHEGKLIINYD